MTVCVVNKQKQKEQGCAELKHLSAPAGNLANKVLKIVIEPECTDEFQDKVAKAIEANELCYNCETGFHYIKQ